MDAINNKSVVEAALRESKKKLSDLKFVESLLDKDDFGICIKCKQSIPIGRILFRPQSKKCKCALVVSLIMKIYTKEGDKGKISY